MMNINVRSIRNKTSSLEIGLVQHDPRITIIAETWVRDEIDERVLPTMYKYRKDRASRGGSVALLIQNNIEITLLGHITDTECIYINISCLSHQFTLSTLYRPPDVYITP